MTEPPADRGPSRLLRRPAAARPGGSQDVVRGAVVLVTGAAGGMGALYARRAAREGAAAIALWDLDREGAGELATELTAAGTRTVGVGVDMASRESIAAAAQETREAIGVPTILVNNAGIVRGARFWEHDPGRDIEATMRVNTLGPMWLVREFLPEMMADASRPRRILNVASAAAFTPNPRMSVYAASKWALLGWSESLRLELERDGIGHLAVTAFCPSYVSTGMFEGARGPLGTPILTPQRAVEKAWTGMRRGTPVVTAPWSVRGSVAVKGVLPVRVWDVVAGRLLGVYSSMDDFRGRTAPPARPAP